MYIISHGNRKYVYYKYSYCKLLISIHIVNEKAFNYIYLTHLNIKTGNIFQNFVLALCSFTIYS